MDSDVAYSPKLRVTAGKNGADDLFSRRIITDVKIVLSFRFPFTRPANALVVFSSLLAASGCSGGGGSQPPLATAPSQGELVGLSSHRTPTPVPTRTQSASSSAYATLVQNDKPLVYYRLNDSSGSGATDSSGNGHTGAYVGSPGYSHPALIVGDAAAKSTSFTSGYLTESVTWPQQAITTECWVKPVAADLSGSPRIIGNAWTDNNGNGFMLALDNGQVKFWAGFSSIPTFPLIAGKTYHLVGTYDVNEVPYTTRFYVNDALVGQNWTQTPHPQTGDSSSTYIGVLDALSPGPGIVDHFQGDISDCAIYDHALTPQQVTAHYNAGAGAAAPIPPSPIASSVPSPVSSPVASTYQSAVLLDKPFLFYPLFSNSTTDVSGNNRNLTYVGTPTFDATGANFTNGYGTSAFPLVNNAVSSEVTIVPTQADINGSPRILSNAWADNLGKGFMIWIDGAHI